MRGLTAFVIVMGVVLVVGFGVVIAVIAGRMSRPAPPPHADRPSAESSIAIPRGARVEAMTTGPDRLVLDLVLPDGDRQLLILDLATGARVGMIQLHPAP